MAYLKPRTSLHKRKTLNDTPEYIKILADSFDKTFRNVERLSPPPRSWSMDRPTTFGLNAGTSFTTRKLHRRRKIQFTFHTIMYHFRRNS